ncbi:MULTISPECIES: HTH domain-containing protein [Thermococcus]|nr:MULTISPECIES: HTH domain-containing protein [Thermococcus]
MRMSEVELVFKVLKEAGKPLKSKEIAELAGIDKKEVDKAIKILKKEGKIISPKRCYYAPAE